MVSVCLSSDALLQHLPSYLGFSYLGRGESLHGCSNKAQPLLLTLDEGYLLTATLLDLGRGVTPLAAAPDLGRWVSPLGLPPRSRTRGSSSWPFLRHCSLVLSASAPDLGHGVTPLGRRPSGMGSSWLLPLTSDVGWLLSAALSAPVTAACAFDQPR